MEEDTRGKYVLGSRALALFSSLCVVLGILIRLGVAIPFNTASMLQLATVGLLGAIWLLLDVRIASGGG